MLVASYEVGNLACTPFRRVRVCPSSIELDCTFYSGLHTVICLSHHMLLIDQVQNLQLAWTCSGTLLSLHAPIAALQTAVTQLGIQDPDFATLPPPPSNPPFPQPPLCTRGQ